MISKIIFSENLKVVVGLVFLQSFYAGLHIVSRVLLNSGISKVVYCIYRNGIGFLVLGPLAYFFEKKERPPLTPSLLIQIFCLSLCGITADQGIYLLGLHHTSPLFASSLENSVPAITFVLAAALGLEKVHISRRDGLAKVLGTVVSIGGATVITLYKGPRLTGLAQSNVIFSETAQNWTFGCILLMCHCLLWASWLVLQAPVLKKYPAKFSFLSISCFFGMIQFSTVAVIVERDIDHWKIKSSAELLALLYAGVVICGFVYFLQAWCIDKGGPVSVGVFQPVCTILVAFMAFLVLGDRLYSGGIIGTILIVIGLYAVLWGKSEEKRLENDEKDTLSKHLLDEECGK